MQATEVDALLAKLRTAASDTVALLAGHPITQAWLQGTLDRDRSFALQAQVYHQVAQTVPLLQRSAATCTALAAGEPMYAVLAAHYTEHAYEESQPAPHELLLLERLRRQGFPVDQMPPPFPPLQEALKRAWWAAGHTPLYELGRAWVKEVVSQYMSGRVAPVSTAAERGHASEAADFYAVHATADPGHSAENARILRELSGYPSFEEKAAEVLAGATDAYEQTRGSLEYLNALARPSQGDRRDA
jgi:hypothetical protein